MSFKTSVLIWFSRFRGTASPPAPLLQRGGRLTGRGFCVRQRNMVLDRMQRDIFFNDISSGDIVTKEHMTMLLTACSFVTLSYL